MRRRRPVAVGLGAGVLVVAVVTAVAGWALGGPGLADLLADDAPLYAAAIAWVCLAPLPIALALLATRWTPWPWVAVVGVHLVVLTAASARLRRLVPGSVWLGVGLTVVLGVASAVAVTASRAAPAAAPRRRAAGAPAPAPGDPTSRPRD